jgi:hypothetical protein
MGERGAQVLSILWLVVKVLALILFMSSGLAGFVYQNF